MRRFFHIGRQNTIAVTTTRHKIEEVWGEGKIAPEEFDAKCDRARSYVFEGRDAFTNWTQSFIGGLALDCGDDLSRGTLQHALVLIEQVAIDWSAQ